MMLSPSMVKQLVTNVRLVTRNEKHFMHLMDNLAKGVTDQHIDGSFDAFAFAWGLLPQWAKIMLLSVAYREHKTVFSGIKPTTPIEHFTEKQREVLATACEKLLIVVVTLMADHNFSEEFYSGWLPARRDAINQQQNNEQLEKAA